MLEADATYQKILRLESNALLLGGDETTRLIGYKYAMETGGTLDKAVLLDIERLCQKVTKMEKQMRAEPDQFYRDAYGATVNMEPVLTVKKIFSDLAGASAMLSPQEKHVVDVLGKKVTSGQKLSQPEMEGLLAIHADKGF